MSKTTITAKMRSDGTLVEVLGDGSERPMPESPMRPMSDEEIEAAAWADPDARPFTDEEWAKARRVPRVKTLRRALGLTQQQFAARYRIPLGTLRDWEQGRSEPDQPARAYLTVIAHDSEGVARAFTSRKNTMTQTDDWSSAPKDGREINVSFPDGKTVTKARWNTRTSGWEVPRRGKWTSMREVHGSSEPIVWWP